MHRVQLRQDEVGLTISRSQGHSVPHNYSQGFVTVESGKPSARACKKLRMCSGTEPCQVPVPDDLTPLGSRGGCLAIGHCGIRATGWAGRRAKGGGRPATVLMVLAVDSGRRSVGSAEWAPAMHPPKLRGSPPARNGCTRG